VFVLSSFVFANNFLEITRLQTRPVDAHNLQAVKVTKSLLIVRWKPEY